MRSFLLVSLVVTAALGGCGKKKTEVDRLADDAKDVVLPDIRAKIAGGRLEDAIPCSRVTANVDRLESDGYEDIAKDIHQVCDHDLQLAYIKRETEAAEAARKASPDEKVMRACFNGKMSISVQRIVDARRLDDEARAFIARFNKVCPENAIEDSELSR